MESCKIANLYNLDETIAKELFRDLEYPWEALPKISSFILELGSRLPEEKYEKRGYVHGKPFAEEILEKGSYKNLEKTRYVNDKQITDHYAIVPTGQGMGALGSLHPQAAKVYETVVRRFLSIFYPPAVYQKVSIVSVIEKERLFSSFKILVSEGYLKVVQNSFAKKKDESPQEDGEQTEDTGFLEILQTIKKGSELDITGFQIKEGETSPPKRYTSGSMILAMENAGQLIEDEERRAQIKGSGIGTSATNGL